ncbi:hypothetical protein CISIN_1g003871mg [Citrus sinensis]|uniref:CTLH domain-containing protein n=1 Tax=Citrus sinensis TaxID=2711 RepID=A0A067F309_CITSI|nr:hypothetical protein CISIN_1g003871mg [Citrus sinensis]
MHGSKMCIDKDTYTHLITLIMKFLEEENFKESLQALEQESKIFFNVHRFGEIVMNGEWEKAEKYLSAFTKLDDSNHSKKMFFELRKHKYCEALCRHERTEADSIFRKDLKVFSVSQNRIDCELAELLALKDLRENEQLSGYTNATSSRAKLIDSLKLLVKENRILQDKLIFPCVNNSALSSLIKLICPSFEKETKEELIYLIHQFLNEEEFKETLHKQQKLPSDFAERAHLFDDFKVLVERNPMLQDKLKFPSMDKSRLLSLIKQIMDWWVPYCINVMPNANNETISLKDFPTVSNLRYASSILTDKPNQEGRPLDASSGDDSNDSSCFNDNNQSRESTSLPDADSAVCAKSLEKSVNLKLQLINEPSECRTLLLPDNSFGGRVVRLIYSHSGDFLVALTQTATHKLWKWQSNKQSLEEENVNMESQLYQPSSKLVMTNDIAADPKDSISCFALRGSHLFSASGGKISIFSLETFQTLATFANPPPIATYFILLPQDLFAFGFDDSSILVHCPCTKKTKAKLKGHQNRITCLAYSLSLNVLVSSGADAQLCVWDAVGWKKLCSKFLHSFQTGLVPETTIVNHIQFHPDQIHLLSIHEGQIDVYEAPTLNHTSQLVPDKMDLPITYATYSCDGKCIYVSCKSGHVKVFDTSTLELRCQINLTAYAQPGTISLELYPLVIAAHPLEPNRIALGLTNGRVHVIEPLESEVEWGKLPFTDSREFSTTFGSTALE